jgi:hypothetical protein
MIDASSSLALAGAITGSDLADYLVKTGWAQRPSKIQGISILSKRLGESPNVIEFILPVTSGFDDERRRVADALRSIEAVERRPMTAIVEDALQQAAEHNTAAE